MSDEPTLLFDVLDALEDALKHCAPNKRKALADTLDAYSKDCAEDFWWALDDRFHETDHIGCHHSFLVNRHFAGTS
jgi:hypothetical protein